MMVVGSQPEADPLLAENPTASTLGRELLQKTQTSHVWVFASIDIVFLFGYIQPYISTLRYSPFYDYSQ